jgi:DnaJ family protein B protein 6
MSPTSMFRIGGSPFGSPTGGNSNVNIYSSSSRGRFGGGPSGGSKWVSESYSTSNVNGVTYTKVTRRDSEVSHVNSHFDNNHSLSTYVG